MVDVNRYIGMQGSFLISKRSATGKPLGFEYLGNCMEATIRNETAEYTHKESQTGLGITDLRFETGLRAMLNITAESITVKNLARALYGNTTALAGATISAEQINDVLAGYSYSLARINLTSFTSLTDDGTPTPTTFVNGTDYTVDLKSGTINLIAGGAIVDGDNLRANYVAGKSEKVSALSGNNTNYWVRFNGLNRAEDLAPVVLDFYKVRFNLPTDIAIITDEIIKFSVEGEILYDQLQPDTTPNGRFYRVQQVDIS